MPSQSSPTPWRSPPDGQIIWRKHIDCFAMLHRFDSAGNHLGTDVERVNGTRASEREDWTKFEEIIARLGKIEFRDIRVKPFRVEIGKVVHGLIYECGDAEDPNDPSRTYECVMLDPDDIMFHPPWDSGEYST